MVTNDSESKFLEKHIDAIKQFGKSKKDAVNVKQVEALKVIRDAYKLTEQWASQLQEVLFNSGVVRLRKSTINQAGNVTEYTWAKIYPTESSPIELAYTVGISAGGFTIKLDTVGASNKLRKLYIQFKDRNETSITKTVNFDHFPKSIEIPTGRFVTVKELVQWSREEVNSFSHTYQDVTKELNLKWGEGESEVFKENSLKCERGDSKLSLNSILYGPPGTGKTYHTVQMAVDAAIPGFSPADTLDNTNSDEIRQAYKAKYDELIKAGRIRFVTFHQSYGYEEFVEGLSAKTDGGQLSYFEKDGVFKAICDVAKDFRVTSKGSELSQFEQRWQLLANDLSESDSGIRIETLSKRTYFTVTDVTDSTIRFDKSNGISVHSLSVKTLKAVYHNEKQINGGLQPYYGALIAYLNQFDLPATESCTERKHFVLIIDEINRGNISKVFGELITLIEPSKRLGQAESLEVTLPYSGDSFSVPDNLYIIGTMNTADRSLALMDTALRRRFDFVEMMPDYKVLHDENDVPYCIIDGGSEENFKINLPELLHTLNNRITALYDREHVLGHAFLIPVIEKLKTEDHQGALAELEHCFKNKILPLLAEYFFEDWQKIHLVLGDNQKPETAQLIKKQGIDIASLFGDNEEIDVIDDDSSDYQLIATDSPMWQQLQTYIGIYHPKSIKE